MTRITARAGRARAVGAHLCFLPWLCLTQGGLESSADRPLNLSQSDSRVRSDDVLLGFLNISKIEQLNVCIELGCGLLRLTRGVGVPVQFFRGRVLGAT
jgi:hypothetical protein